MFSKVNEYRNTEKYEEDDDVLILLGSSYRMIFLHRLIVCIDDEVVTTEAMSVEEMVKCDMQEDLGVECNSEVDCEGNNSPSHTLISAAKISSNTRLLEMQIVIVLTSVAILKRFLIQNSYDVFMTVIFALFNIVNILLNKELERVVDNYNLANIKQNLHPWF